MIENKDVAIEISNLMLKLGKELNESIFLVQSKCDEKEFEEYRSAVGFLMGNMWVDIMRKIYEKHPEIKPEELL